MQIMRFLKSTAVQLLAPFAIFYASSSGAVCGLCTQYGCEPVCNFTLRTKQGCPAEKELKENFKWLDSDAIHAGNSATVRKNILRAISITLQGDIQEIRQAYKYGQSHNSSAAGLIDDCDDDSVSRIAYDFAERVVRLRSCGGRAPASSATCGDLAENLRWSLLDSGNCAPYAREWLVRALRSNDYEKVRAEWVRRAVQVAQGHDLPVAASVDFISDRIILDTARKVYDEYDIGNLDRRPGDPQNPFVRQTCPGVTLFNSYE